MIIIIRFGSTWKKNTIIIIKQSIIDKIFLISFSHHHHHRSIAISNEKTHCRFNISSTLPSNYFNLPRLVIIIIIIIIILFLHSEDCVIDWLMNEWWGRSICDVVFFHMIFSDHNHQPLSIDEWKTKPKNFSCDAFVFSVDGFFFVLSLLFTTTLLCMKNLWHCDLFLKKNHSIFIWFIIIIIDRLKWMNECGALNLN